MPFIIYFDICAILITAVFIVSLVIRKRIAGRNNYLMFSMLLLTTVASVADLLFCQISNHASAVSGKTVILLHICCDIYFLARNMILPIYLFFIYTSIGIWHMFDLKKHLLPVWTVCTGLPILMIFANFFLPFVFRISPDGSYTALFGTYIFHAIAIIFGVWGALVLLHYRKVIRLDKMVVLYFIYPLVILSVLIQIIYPAFRFEMFGISIALLTFMLTIQSSENMVDPLVGAKKYSSGIDNLLNIINTKRPSTILLIKLVNNGNILMYLGQEVHDHYLSKLSGELNRIAAQNGYDADLYYLEYGLFGFMSEEDLLEKAYETADALKHYFSDSHRIDDFDVLADARICIIQNPDDFDDFQSMFNFATSFQNTLPSSKKVLLYDDYKDQPEFRIRNDLGDIISRAITNNSFEMYYQPIYSVVEKRFVCAEALIRLTDEEYGMIPPSLFIPLAETNGSIHAIGEWVLQDVFRFMSENNTYELGMNYIEINLSVTQCIEPDLADRIEHLLDVYNLVPEQLSLELTETSADIDPEIVDKNVRRLHNMGIRFALDDYGTGYSNIRRVVSLPFDQVKLDRSFVEGVNDPNMWIVIEDTISMLKEMGKEVLVEGVEEESVAKRFLQLPCDLLQGCEYIQGFYFCKPLPENEFIEFMHKHAAENAS